jgi:predicted acylesterase/phospholipase RssA
VVATSLRELKPVMVRFQSKDGLKLALKASATIPWVAGGPVEIDGDRYYDASAAGSGSVPFKMAIDEGATHILALRTRPAGVLRGKANSFEKLFMSRKIRRDAPLLVAHYLERAADYAHDIRALTDATLARPDVPPYVYAVTLAQGTEPVAQLEKDHNKLLEGAAHGFRATYRSFCESEPRIVANELTGFNI